MSSNIATMYGCSFVGWNASISSRHPQNPQGHDRMECLYFLSSSTKPQGHNLRPLGSTSLSPDEAFFFAPKIEISNNLRVCKMTHKLHRKIRHFSHCHSLQHICSVSNRSAAFSPRESTRHFSHVSSPCIHVLCPSIHVISHTHAKLC